MKKNQLFFYIFLVLYLEFSYKLSVYHHINGIDILYTILFSIPVIFILTLISSVFRNKANQVISLILTSFFCIYFIFSYIFYSLFSVPFSFETIGLASQALDFTNIIVDALGKNILIIFLFIIPIIAWFFLRKKIDFNQIELKEGFIGLGLIIIFYTISILSLQWDKNGLYSAYNIYFHIREDRKTILNFGLVTYTRLDIKRSIFGFNESIVEEAEAEEEKDTENNEEEELPEEVITYNQIDIDFDGLIANTNESGKKKLLEYLKNTAPTNQNDYTGYFKGKNLIFILAEGFNSIAVDAERTPTLYKLINNGFVFNNFYSPVFLSTTGGEFQATTGLIPTQTILKNWKSNTPNIYYALGNSFNRLGYTTNAYHNWTYSYYERNKTMKTLGFYSYTGCRNGLELEMNCRWLPSDIDLMNVTFPKYGTEEKFMTYYITVSGHAPYNFTGGNNIASKNKNLVADLPYSNNVKAYLASQIELDRALESLIQQLEEKNILDNTVIALVGDHYPYTLSIDEINEVSSYERDEIVEVNRSNFIIWNSEMKNKVEINKVGSQIDVLPTILNLFGIEYDSRLLVGKDILSNSEGIAIFSNRSWVTNKGTYFANQNKFVSADNTEVDNEYIRKINTKVANGFTISDSIIKYNIYDDIFK